MKTIDSAMRLASTLSAHELDRLISKLGELRAATTPPVPHQRPDPRAADASRTFVTIEDNTDMTAARVTDGRIRLWARSSGYGWLGFTMLEHDARALRDWMAANVLGPSDLLGESHGPSH